MKKNIRFILKNALRFCEQEKKQNLLVKMKIKKACLFGKLGCCLHVCCSVQKYQWFPG